MGQCQCNCACARAQIQRPALGGQRKRQRRFYQQFGFRPRDEGGGAYTQRQRPEFSFAHYVGYGFTGLAAA